MSLVYKLIMHVAPPKNASLAVMRAFLQDPLDGEQLERLLSYNMPASFSIKTFDDDVSFIIIEPQLPDEIMGIDMKAMPIITWTILAKGIGGRWMPGEGYSADPGDIVKKALSCEDIFVVYGPNKTSEIYSRLVAEILGHDSMSFPDVTVEAYRRRLSALVSPVDPAAQKLETLRVQIEQYAQTYESAMEVIKEAYQLTAPIGEAALLLELGKIMEDLGRPRPVPKRTTDMLRQVDALPDTAQKFADNGLHQIHDFHHRLMDFSLSKELQAAAASIREHCEAGHRQELFVAIKEFKRVFFREHLPSKSPFITEALRNRIIFAISQSRARAATRQPASSRVALFERYLENIDIECLYKYRRQFDGTRPFLCGSTAVIDMDAVQDESEMRRAIESAQRVIALGGCAEGLFSLMMMGAHAQALVDGSQRIASCGRRHVNINRIWYYPTSLDITSFVMERTQLGQSVGVLTTFEKPDLLRQLTGSGLHHSKYRIGTLRDLYYDEFDVLIWFFEPFEERRMMQAANARAKDTLALVGDPNELPKNSPLTEFYHACAGDERYGKIYR